MYSIAIDTYLRYVNLRYFNPLVKCPILIKSGGMQYFTPSKDRVFYKVENLSALKSSAHYRNLLFDIFD